jgi:hypothetical protein
MKRPLMHGKPNRRRIDPEKMSRAVKQWQQMMNAKAEAKRDAKAEQDIVRKRLQGVDLRFKDQRQRYEFFTELNEGIIPRMIFARVSPNGIMELIRLGHGPRLLELIQKYFQGYSNENETAELERMFKYAKEKGKQRDNILKGNEIGKRRMKEQIARVQFELQQMMEMRNAV